MRAAIGMVGLLAVLATGYYFYSAQVPQSEVDSAPNRQIDLVRVRGDLLSLAQAERLYLAANGRYGTLEQLRRSGHLSYVPGGREYSYEAEIDGASHFRITARPAPDRTGLPVLSIDETMRIAP